MFIGFRDLVAFPAAVLHFVEDMTVQPKPLALQMLERAINKCAESYCVAQKLTV